MTEIDKDMIKRDVKKALAVADLLTGVDGNLIAAATVVGAGMILTDILVEIKARLEE